MKRTIHFIDNGQDFLEWDIDEEGIVVGCRPCQAGIWRGTEVLNKNIECCSLLDIQLKDGSIRTLAHRVVRVDHSAAVNGLVHTSVDDCKCSLEHYADILFLRELLLECERIGHKTRAHYVKRRIKKLEEAA